MKKILVLLLLVAQLVPVELHRQLGVIVPCAEEPCSPQEVRISWVSTLNYTSNFEDGEIPDSTPAGTKIATLT
jgi:hypothetical protein